MKKISSLILMFFLSFAGMISTVSADMTGDIFIGSEADTININEGDTIEEPLLINIGPAQHPTTVDLYIAKSWADNGNNKFAYFDVSFAQWKEFTQVSELKPIHTFKNENIKEYFTYPSPRIDTTGMTSFSLYAFVINDLNGDNPTYAIRGTKVMITPATCVLVANPSSLNETAPADNSNIVKYIYITSCGKAVEISSDPVSPYTWLEAKKQSGGIVHVTLKPSQATSEQSTAQLTISTSKGTLKVPVTLSKNASTGGGGPSGPPPQGPPVEGCTSSSPAKVYPKNVSFYAQQGQSVKPSQDISVSDCKGGALSYSNATVASGGTWLRLVTASSGSGLLTIEAYNTNMPASDTPYTGSVTFNPQGKNSETIAVKYSITGQCVPKATAGSTSISKTVTVGASAVADEIISITNGCGANLPYTVKSVTAGTTNSWITSPHKGDSIETGKLTVQFNPANMSVGPNSGSIVLTTGIGEITISVNVTVTQCVPQATASSTSISKTVTVGSSAVADEIISITNGCGANLPYTVKSVTAGTTNSWITSPLKGDSIETGKLTVQFNPANMSVGPNSGSIVLTTGIGEITISVNVNVTSTDIGNTSGDAIRIYNNKIQFFSYSPGQERFFYFIDDRTAAGSGTTNVMDLHIDMMDMNATNGYNNIDMIAKYSGTTCQLDKSAMQTALKQAQAEAEHPGTGLTHAAGKAAGFYFSISKSDAFESIDVPAPNPEGCWFVMVKSMTTVSEPSISINWYDIDVVYGQ